MSACLVCGHGHDEVGECLVLIPWAGRLNEGGDYPVAAFRTESGRPAFMPCRCPVRIDIEVSGCERHGPPPVPHMRYLPCLACDMERADIDARCAAADIELRPVTDAYLAECRRIHEKHGINPGMLHVRYGDDEYDE